MTDRADDATALLGAHREETVTVAHNLSTRYVAIAAEAVVGLLILPFNVAHLGKDAYGLWTLTASITAYFSVLDLGYTGALVKYVAEYRARRDVRALNEVLSTTFCIFACCAVVMYGAALVLAAFIDHLFTLSPEQVHAARVVLLVTSANVACGTAFAVYGGVINGFQRYHVNNVVGTISGLITALVNVTVLWLGYGLVELVVAVTAVRILTYWVYRANAYRVFPGLRVRPSLFRRARLRQLTGISVDMAVIDWAQKLNYSMDAVVIGAFLSTGFVALWSVGQRLSELAQRLANQLNDMLFPAVVENDTNARIGRLQLILIQGTRLSLASAMVMAGTLFLVARPLVLAWVGPDFSGSVIVLQLLSLVVIVRVGTATATVLLKGSGHSRFVAIVNSAAAIANIAISIALVKPFGLGGVAAGTLIPVATAACLVIFPAGCRRVGLPIGTALMQAVWPAAWPAVVMALVVMATRPVVADNLIGVALVIALAAAAYLVTFFFLALRAADRRFYVDKVSKVIPRWRLRPVSEGV
jgi:O-antigen/teichoic acid export membrane protein